MRRRAKLSIQLTSGLALLLPLIAFDAMAQQSPGNTNPISVEGGTAVSTSPTGAYFFDNYEYAVARTDVGALPIFLAHGYTLLKSIPSSGNDLRTGGYIFTQPDAALSSRVLVLESHPSFAPMPGFGYGQTDYYLQLGGPARQAMPANHWIQFWTYHTADSRFGPRDKTIYPCRGEYPCQAGMYGYIFLWGRQGCQYAQSEADYGPADRRLICMGVEFADNRAAPEYPSGRTELFQNVNTMPIMPGRWYQVRYHIDMSGAEGSYEAWIRERGQTAWTKVADWRSGVTPNFSWPIPASARSGFTYMRFPTTVNGQYGDSTTYLDDFTIGRTEAELPR